jgi:hypothetical protein
MKETGNLFDGDVDVARRRRTFTLEQANSALPLVRRIIADIVSSYREIAAMRQRLAQDSLTLSGREQLESAAEHQEQVFDALVDELTEIGCELKDPDMGLVDFVGRHAGRDVNLCWRMGEDRVAWWHEVHAGFAGRRPASTLNEQG